MSIMAHAPIFVPSQPAFQPRPHNPSPFAAPRQGRTTYESSMSVSSSTSSSPPTPPNVIRPFLPQPDALAAKSPVFSSALGLGATPEPGEIPSYPWSDSAPASPPNKNGADDLDQALLRSFGPSGANDYDSPSYLRSRIATASDLRDGLLSPPSTGGFFPRPDPTGSDPENTTVFLGNVSSTRIKEEHIWPIFSVFGEIEYVKIPPRIGVAFVKYRQRCCAVQAIEKMQDFQLFDCRFRVGWGRSEKDDKPPQNRSTQIAEVKKGIASLVGVGDVKASQLMLAMTVLSRPEYAGTLQQLVDVGSQPSKPCHIGSVWSPPDRAKWAYPSPPRE